MSKYYNLSNTSSQVGLDRHAHADAWHQNEVQLSHHYGTSITVIMILCKCHHGNSVNENTVIQKCDRNSIMEKNPDRKPLTKAL